MLDKVDNGRFRGVTARNWVLDIHGIPESGIIVPAGRCPLKEMRRVLCEKSFKAEIRIFDRDCGTADGEYRPPT